MPGSIRTLPQTKYYIMYNHAASSRHAASLCLASTLLITTLTALTSCSDVAVRQQLDRAESLVTRHADSTLMVLDSIDSATLDGENLARWGMLHTWALYRNYAQDIPEEPLQNAFDYYADSDDALRRAQVYYLRSAVGEDQQRGDPRQWLEDMYTACLAIEKTDDHVLAAQIYQRYEHKLYTMHQYEEAIGWAERFYDEAVKSNSISEQILALTNLSLAQLMSEERKVKNELRTDDGETIARYANYSEAFGSIYQALGLARQHGRTRQEGKVCGNLSSYYSRSQQLDSALFYALKAKEIDETLLAQGKSKGPINYLHVADAYRKAGMADSAIYYAEKCMQYPGIATRRNAAQLLYNIYCDLKGDYKTSLEWMRVYNSIQDSIHRQIEVEQIGATQDAVVREQEKGQLQTENFQIRMWMLWTTLASLVIIVLVVLRMVHNRTVYNQKAKEQEAEMNRIIEDMQRIKSTAEAAPSPAIAPAEPKPIPTSITLTGSTREQLVIDPKDILFLTSESNYIKVVYVGSEGKLQSKLLRQTMGRIEEMLSDVPSLVRCHRAFIINLSHVTHATSVPIGLSLTLDATTTSIPVSRTYIGVVKERLMA